MNGQQQQNPAARFWITLLLLALAGVAILFLFFLLAATVPEAVTIDLSSAQEGGVVHPGDTVELTVTVTNDWVKTGRIRATLTGTNLPPERYHTL